MHFFFLTPFTASWCFRANTWLRISIHFQVCFPFFCLLFQSPVLPHVSSYPFPLSFPVEFLNQIVTMQPAFLRANWFHFQEKQQKWWLNFLRTLNFHMQSLEDLPSFLKVARYSLKYWPLWWEKNIYDSGGTLCIYYNYSHP